MKKELRFVKSGMKMYYKNTLYAGKGEIFNDKNFDYPEKPLKYKHIRRISD